ncbi:MAG: 2,3-bisphosphoglycerate-independent phosphoglycerate mutase [Myxococcota bacterium]|nr:2,3-bisphosphoglycerate-independent phosphoglycerate mutase [Myxococcota bacterium]
MNTPVVLVVLDGYGVGDGGAADATEAAHTPFLTEAATSHPSASIETSGEAVGLPPGQMGNSEVGHMTMGAGRIIEQDLTRIGQAFQLAPAEEQGAVRMLFEALEESGGTLHLMGLLSDGGVHSHADHLEAILQAAGRAKIPTAVHVFLDGRDTPPRSGLDYLKTLMPHIEAADARIATVSGRYYAMDRDSRWERISEAYHAIVCREGLVAQDAVSAVEAAYARGESDEFVKPTTIEGGPALQDGDAVFFFNFRADRARELTNAITGARAELFAGELERRAVAQLTRFLCMTEYDAAFDLPVAFPPEVPSRVLGEVVSAGGLSQLRMAETEKYAHVTFFFNSGVEQPFPDEDRALISSPRDVATYDHRPEMSALQVTQTLMNRIEEGDYAFVLVNYANPDMVGHTGVMDAAVKAVETIDSCLEKLAAHVLECGGQMLITADHGNCELMRDPETGEPHTAHTTNPVPIHWITRNAAGRLLRDGTLADIAPTILDLLGMEAPRDMTGRSLIVS